MEDQKVRIKFGESEEMEPEEEGKDYKRELINIRSAIAQGDQKKALQLIDMCLGEEESPEDTLEEEKSESPMQEDGKIRISFK